MIRTMTQTMSDLVVVVQLSWLLCYLAQWHLLVLSPQLVGNQQLLVLWLPML